MRTVVYQACPVEPVPAWLERCLRSVQDWAAVHGFDYRRCDGQLAGVVPAWYRRKVAEQPRLVSDLARLVLAKQLLAQGCERAVWLDADVLVFDPARLLLPAHETFACGQDAWVEREGHTEHGLHNAVLLFARDEPFLDFYLQACLRLVAGRKQLHPAEVGSRFLTQLARLLPLPVLPQVGAFSPLVVADLAQGGGPWLHQCVQATPAWLCAVKLGGAWRGPNRTGLTLTESHYQQAVDQCLRDVGAVLQQDRERPAEPAPVLPAEPAPPAEQEAPAFSLLVSTFSSLLLVTLDERYRLQGVRRVHHGQGIYFGLAQAERRVFAIARNLSQWGHVQDARWGTNALLEFRWPAFAGVEQLWTLPGLRDPHQLAYRDGLLWTVCGYRPELQAWHPDERRRVGQVVLADLVPPELRHAAPPRHPDDPYHFNSLHFAGDRLWVLAHNWRRGAFALELAYEGLDSLLSRPRCLRTVTGLGQESHNVCLADEELLVLSSAANSMVTGSGRTQAVPDLHGQPGFLRGLALDEQVCFLGQGAFAEERSGRESGPTRLVVLDRVTLQPRGAVDVGAYGNPCDLLLLPRAGAA